MDKRILQGRHINILHSTFYLHYYRGQEWVELYINTPIYPHGLHRGKLAFTFTNEWSKLSLKHLYNTQRTTVNQVARNT